MPPPPPPASSAPAPRRASRVSEPPPPSQSPSPSPSPSHSPSPPAPPARSKPGSSPALSYPNESARGRTLTYQDLSRCFHLPINTAARELGVCVTALKKQCRKNGVPRWPHRKLKSLDKLKEKLEKEEATAADKEYYKHEIHSIVQKKDHIFRAAPVARDGAPTRPDRAKSSHALAPDPRLHARVAHPMLPPEHPALHGQPLVMQAPVPRPTSIPPQPHMPQPGMAPLPIPPQHLSLCGFMGCDCYVNGGVSSQNYHVPIPTCPPGSLPPANPSMMSSNPQQNPSAPSQSSQPHFYGTAPPTYAYPAHLPYPPSLPFQNMVQVNVMEQQPYGHHPNAIPTTSQPQVVPTPHGAPVGTASAVGNSPNLHQPSHVPPQSPQPSGPGSGVPPPPPSYEVYAPAAQGSVGQPANGFLYGSFPAQGQNPFEGVIQAQPASCSSPSMVPPYWPDMQHAANSSNLVTMYNQTTHHHHHHAAESGTGAHSTGGGVGGGTASFDTNNSDAGNSRSVGARPKEMSQMQTGTTITESQGTAAQKATVKRNGILGDGAQKNGTSNVIGTSGPKKMSKTISERTGVVVNEKIANAQMLSSVRKERKVVSSKQNVQAEKNGEKSNVRLDTSAKKDGVFRQNVGTGTRAASETGVDRGKGVVKNGIATHVAEGNICTTPKEQVTRKIANGTIKEGQSASLERNGTSIEMRGGSGRSPNKRPRISSKDNQAKKAKSWGESYITAGNTGVPVMVQSGHQRGITPPSDREETPDDQDNGTGSGSGSGTGDGTGSGSGSGSGSGDGNEADSDGSKEEEEGSGGRKRKREPASPSVREKGARHGADGLQWCMGGREDTGHAAGHVLAHGQAHAHGAASAMVRARRYEHVVHHCVSLLCAQWCTDTKFRVVISLGSKMLLGLAGVGSHGRSVFEGGDSGMVEGLHSMRSRYCCVMKGQRQEWVATMGRKRYLVVLSPFRRRSGAEISGVSGLLMELTQRMAHGD